MADEATAPVVEVKLGDKSEAAASAETKNTDTKPQEIMIPKHRYDEVSSELKTLRDDAAKKALEQQAEDEKKLAAQNEWQKLADNRKAKVEELTPKAELADKLTTMVTEQYATEIAAWPEQVKAMAPSDDASILTKLEWMRKAKPLATELMADTAPIHGNGRRPTPSGVAGSGRPTKIEPIYDVRKNF